MAAFVEQRQPFCIAVSYMLLLYTLHSGTYNGYFCLTKAAVVHTVIINTASVYDDDSVYNPKVPSHTLPSIVYCFFYAPLFVVA